jgi:ABC-type uncharacterized transport system permease subunit
VALIAALLFLVIAIKVFSLGLKRYQTSSYVVARA